MAAIIARGDCHDRVWQPASGVSQIGSPLSAPFTRQCINTSMRFYPILTSMTDGPLTAVQQSQSSYCYHSFLQPHIAQPVFQILLAELCLSAPAHGAKRDWILSTICKAIAGWSLTEFEVTALVGGYEGYFQSHAFVDVDSKGIFNAIMAHTNWCVHHFQINLSTNSMSANQSNGLKMFCSMYKGQGFKRAGIFCNSPLIGNGLRLNQWR